MTHYIILRADDLVPDEEDPSRPMGKWENLINYAYTKKIKLAVGLVGHYLTDPDFVGYIESITYRAHDMSKAKIEFFNHGYYHAKKEYLQSWQIQRKYLLRTMIIAKRMFGLDLSTFGPPFNQWNKSTKTALFQIPRIKTICCFNSPEVEGKLSIDHPAAKMIENPTHRPNYLSFKKQFGLTESPIVIILHPGSWGNDDFGQFRQCINWLQRDPENKFITPHDWYLIWRDAPD